MVKGASILCLEVEIACWMCFWVVMLSSNGSPLYVDSH